MALPAEPRVNRAVDRDALPGQLAVRGNKAPTVGARFGRGSRSCRGSPGRDDVGGPSLHSAGGATGCDDHCSKKCRALHCEPPWLTMRDCKQVQSWSARNTGAVCSNAREFRSEWQPRNSHVKRPTGSVDDIIGGIAESTKACRSMICAADLPRWGYGPRNCDFGALFFCRNDPRLVDSCRSNRSPSPGRVRKKARATAGLFLLRGFLLVVAAGTRRGATVLGVAGSAQCGRTVCIAVRIAVVRMQDD